MENKIDELKEVVPMDFKEETELEKDDKVMIFQHPHGKPTQFSNGAIIDVIRPFVRYKANTDPGSSGSPVLRNLDVIAIHHSRVEKGFKQGTLCSAIIQDLNTGKCKLILFLRVLRKLSDRHSHGHIPLGDRLWLIDDFHNGCHLICIK